MGITIHQPPDQMRFIKLTHVSDGEILVRADHISMLEHVPNHEPSILLANSERIPVTETPEQILALILGGQAIGVTEPPSPPPLVLQKGKRYVRRNGGIATINSFDCGVTNMPWKCDYGYWYYPDGRISIYGNNQEDLISEHVEEVGA